MGGNTTFGRVVWAVGQISRSDLVQVGVDGKWECLGGCIRWCNGKFPNLLVNSPKFTVNFGRYMAIWGKYHFWECCVGCGAHIEVRLGQVGVYGKCECLLGC